MARTEAGPVTVRTAIRLGRVAVGSIPGWRIWRPTGARPRPWLWRVEAGPSAPATLSSARLLRYRVWINAAMLAILLSGMHTISGLSIQGAQRAIETVPLRLDLSVPGSRGT